jgi:hypothetical protein
MVTAAPFSDVLRGDELPAVPARRRHHGDDRCGRASDRKLRHSDGSRGRVSGRLIIIVGVVSTGPLTVW